MGLWEGRSGEDVWSGDEMYEYWGFIGIDMYVEVMIVGVPCCDDDGMAGCG